MANTVPAFKEHGGNRHLNTWASETVKAETYMAESKHARGKESLLPGGWEGFGMAFLGIMILRTES